jgi:hypothetical protein
MAYTIENCIIDMMESMGPQDFGDINYECNTQCSPCNTQLVRDNLQWLSNEGKIVQEKNDDDTFYYDFPDSYYLKQAGF